MKIFVVNKAGKKIYISPICDTRNALALAIGGQYFQIANEWFHVSNVRAEPSTNDALIGAIAGGVIGALTGGIGVLIGGITGGAIGSLGAYKETEQVIKFNHNKPVIGRMNASRFIPVFKQLPNEGGTKYNLGFTKGKSGAYIIKENGKIVYVGYSTCDLYKTITRHFQSWNHPHQRVVTYANSINYNRYTIRVVFSSPTKAFKLERALIAKYRPRDNFEVLDLLDYEEKEANKIAKENKKVMEEYNSTDLGYPPEYPLPPLLIRWI